MKQNVASEDVEMFKDKIDLVSWFLIEKVATEAT